MEVNGGILKLIGIVNYVKKIEITQRAIIKTQQTKNSIKTRHLLRIYEIWRTYLVYIKK